MTIVRVISHCAAVGRDRLGLLHHESIQTCDDVENKARI
jgi:hypothetical protein